MSIGVHSDLLELSRKVKINILNQPQYKSREQNCNQYQLIFYRNFLNKIITRRHNWRLLMKSPKCFVDEKCKVVSTIFIYLQLITHSVVERTIGVKKKQRIFHHKKLINTRRIYVNRKIFCASDRRERTESRFFPKLIVEQVPYSIHELIICQKFGIISFKRQHHPIASIHFLLNLEQNKLTLSACYGN
ncbi:MULE domain-containing protein [Aphis craccivora]|uniref:MULE domain-containing protein n=1 Tax=Aphis craccivora TaxID=307492 RepID=A0A6G0ZGZ9_APHCR|nr:MULE domain-containing protein [Aphis craccivora]